MASNRTIELLIVISAKLIVVQLTTEQRIYCACKRSEYFRILSGCVFLYTLFYPCGFYFVSYLIAIKLVVGGVACRMCAREGGGE